MSRFLLALGERSETVIEYLFEVEGDNKADALAKIRQSVVSGEVFEDGHKYTEVETLESGLGTSPSVFFFNEDTFSEDEDVFQVECDGGWIFKNSVQLAAILRMGRKFVVTLPDGTQSSLVAYDQANLNPYRVGDYAISSLWDLCDNSTVWTEVFE